MNLRNFILQNKNWEERLSSPPYNLIIKRKDGYIIFNYHQIKSDFSYDIVIESRGIILDELNDYKVVRKAFNKFFNFGEKYASEIYWDSAVIQEKVDGSIISFWWSERLNKWIVSTNGTIFARDATVPFPDNQVKTFYDMVVCKCFYDEDMNFPYKNHTHTFEIVGPQNKVVIPYKKEQLYYLTSINNETFEETDFYDYFKYFSNCPRDYKFDSLEETIEFTKQKYFNTFRNEGFVVKDKFCDRVKIKTENYLRVHRLRGEHSPTIKRFIELIKLNEQEEFLSYFPEYREDYKRIKKAYDNFLYDLGKLQDQVDTKIHNISNRKEFALWAKDTEYPSFCFSLFDQPGKDYNDFMDNLSEKSFINFIEKYLKGEKCNG
jgi:hypothetical protein